MGCSSSKKISFENYTFDSTPEFSLNGQFLNCRVVDIYDGDTCTCVIPFCNHLYKFIIRLSDIDTCEVKSKNEKNKDLAYQARSRLYQLITKSNTIIDKNIKRKELRNMLNKQVFIITISCGDFDKYGRLLGWLYDKDTKLPQNVENSFNHILIKEKLAYFYQGNTKLSEEEQTEQLTITTTSILSQNNSV